MVWYVIDVFAGFGLNLALNECDSEVDVYCINYCSNEHSIIQIRKRSEMFMKTTLIIARG